MMEVTQGIWTVSSGKGERYYVKCSDNGERTGSGVMHPEQLAGLNGVGMYGYEQLVDLAIAILKFEQIKTARGSILGRLDSKGMA